VRKLSANHLSGLKGRRVSVIDGAKGALSPFARNGRGLNRYCCGSHSRDRRDGHRHKHIGYGQHRRLAVCGQPCSFDIAESRVSATRPVVSDQYFHFVRHSETLFRDKSRSTIDRAMIVPREMKGFGTPEANE
jgi:hypothetical protein